LSLHEAEFGRCRRGGATWGSVVLNGGEPGHKKALQVRHPEGLNWWAEWFQSSGGVAVVVAALLVLRAIGHSGPLERFCSQKLLVSDNGPSQIGTFQVGPVQENPSQVGLTQVGSLQVGPLQVGPLQVGPL
jgi:hypothetical protein